MDMASLSEIGVYGYDLARDYHVIVAGMTGHLLERIETDIFALYSKDGVDDDKRPAQPSSP